MKRILIIALIAIILPILLVGCSGMNAFVGDMGQIDLRNAEASRKLARELLSTWRLNSGFIRGVLQEKVAELPKGVVDAMDQLDSMALEDPAKLDDFELGKSLGLRVRMLSSLVQQALSLYAPEVMKYIPSLLAL